MSQAPAPFIDKVSLFQRHGVDSLPLVGAAREIRSNMEMTALECDKVRPLWREGSHSTKVKIRSDGTSASLEGNPGRFGRPDNVWNLGWSETVEVSNALMAAEGLPPFSAGEYFIRDRVSEHDARRGLFEAYTGAKVSELHVTQNFITGSAALSADAMRWFGGQRMGRVSKGRLGATTLVFGGGKSTKQVELYLKADELLVHARGEKEKQLVKQSQVYQYCRDLGLLRVECKWRRGFLRDNGLNYLGGINMGKLISLFDAETAFLHDAHPDRLARVADNLPRKLRAYALCWLRGDDVRELLSRAQFYRVAKSLRECGIDISECRPRVDDASAELDKLLAGVPSFQFTPAAMPEWYDAAAEVRIAA